MFFKPSFNLDAISRKKTPVLEPGSKNLASLFYHIESGNKSKILFARTGDVKTSSLLKFEIQSRISGL